MGELCCLMALCCPPFSAEQRAAFTAGLVIQFKGDMAKVQEVFDATFEDFARATEKLAAAVAKAGKKDK